MQQSSISSKPSPKQLSVPHLMRGVAGNIIKRSCENWMELNRKHWPQVSTAVRVIVTVAFSWEMPHINTARAHHWCHQGHKSNAQHWTGLSFKALVFFGAASVSALTLVSPRPNRVETAVVCWVKAEPELCSFSKMFQNRKGYPLQLSFPHFRSSSQSESLSQSPSPNIKRS